MTARAEPALAALWRRGPGARGDVTFVRLTLPFFYLSIAGLALSVAGFAGLVTVFRHSEDWTRTALWRLRNIVRLSIVLVLTALLPFPVFALTGDEQMAIRITAAAVIGAQLYEMIAAVRERTEWTDRRWLPIFLVGSTAGLLLHIAVFALASAGLLMLALMVRLEHPMHLFFNTVSGFRPPVTAE